MILASSEFSLQRSCIKCSPTLTGMLVVFLTVDDLHLLGVLVFGCVASCNWGSRQPQGFHSSVAI